MDKELEQQISAFMGEELAKGTSLSQLHSMVNEKFQTRLTYMEIRIIASELQVDWNANDPRLLPLPRLWPRNNIVGPKAPQLPLRGFLFVNCGNTT